MPLAIINRTPGCDVTLSMDSVIARQDGTLFEEADDELVAINLDNGAFYAMNAVASSIFKFIEEPRRAADIRDFLLETYDVDAAVCERQMLAVLEEMLAERLIVRQAGPGAAGTAAP
ncbi:hypothetical protein AB7M35_002533 [Amorphus suaedae]